MTSRLRGWLRTPVAAASDAVVDQKLQEHGRKGSLNSKGFRGSFSDASLSPGSPLYSSQFCDPGWKINE